MIRCKSTVHKQALFLLSLFVFFCIKVSAQDGKTLFQQKCMACHNIFKDMTGPALEHLEERGQWSNHNKLLQWVHNPPAFYAKDPYTAGLFKKFNVPMQSFPDLTLKDVDAIVSYINSEVASAEATPQGTGTSTAEAPKTSNNAVIFGVISLILGIIALILMQVNSNLKKLSDDAEGIHRPEPVPFYRNKIYIAFVSILLFIVAGYYVTKGAIGLGRTKNYQPVQPIYYSHKVHAGINQINCMYCHGGVWEGKQATIPSVNVCMNCHKAITEYSSKSPKLYDENGNEINATTEINKLFQYAGFDPNNPSRWDPSQAKPIEWVRIHNLPNHVFFSHAQHVRVGKVQCQTCHGEITAMDQVKQFSELSMSWCINCHRQTKVDFNYDSTKGNKFYSIYEKFHNDIKSGKMDSVTVKDIGGLECQRCHY